MATAAGVQHNGVAALSRAVVAAAADLVTSLERAVVGESKVRTARGNAWDAIQADRARAQARQEMDQLVRALVATGPRATVTTGPRATVANRPRATVANGSRATVAAAPRRSRTLTSAGR